MQRSTVKYTIATLTITVLSLFGNLWAQTDDTKNWVKTKTYKTEQSSSQSHTQNDDVSTNITYYDGLGRAIQSIGYHQGGTGGDMITPIVYDDLGRQQKQYLPFERSSNTLNLDSSPLTNVQSFYNTSEFQNTTNPYSETAFEKSPLNRVLKRAAPGDDWAMDNGHEVKYKYTTNSTNEVHRFNVTTSNTSLPTVSYSGYYFESELYKTVTYDENNTASTAKGSIIEFKDKLGRVILKRHISSTTGYKTDTNPSISIDTYYIYDDYNNLVAVLPPELSEQIINGSNLVSNHTQLENELGYKYVYDYRNRLIQKKLPGKHTEFIAYDPLNRVVATGPSYSPFGDSIEGWLHTKYDSYNRVAYTLWKAASVNETIRQSLQPDYNDVLSEDRITATNTVIGIDFNYTNNVSPTGAYYVLSINYYDDYSWQGAPASIPSTVCEGASAVFYNNTTTPKGMPTGSWNRIITNKTSSDGKIQYMLYDNKARVIRAYTGYDPSGYTQVDTEYSFYGNVLHDITTHKKSSSQDEVRLQNFYTYDAQERLSTHSHKVNTEPIIILSNNEYDSLGRLISKKTGATDVAANNHYQDIDYKYNVRGWLTSINNVNNLDVSGEPTDLFAQKINYNDVSNTINGTVDELYNGNIAEISWRTSSDNIRRRYGYTYDYLNRLRDAWYQKPGTTNPVPQSYDEHMSYDRNGNIMTLSRNGSLELNTTVVAIDNLVYSYDDGNKLLNVIDNEAHPEGFKDGNIGENQADDNDYEYDTYGNLIIDRNKGITNITYNHLNLPVKITFSTQGDITYIYDAQGIKLNKEVLEENVTTSTSYLDTFQYIEDKIDFIFQSEGVVKVSYPNNPQNPIRFTYAFEHKDHLGNVRVVYFKHPQTGVLTIGREDHYYPFGLKHEGYNEEEFVITVDANDDIVLTPVQQFQNNSLKYGFGGKEEQTELDLNFLDFGARNYDAALGRWMNIDPHAENYLSWSPYNYVGSNPIIRVDPDGKDWDIVIDHNNRTVTIRANYSTLNNNSQSVENASSTWNAQSGKYQYTVGRGENKISYDVNFEITTNNNNTDSPDNDVSVLPDSSAIFEERTETLSDGTEMTTQVQGASDGQSFAIKDSQQNNENEIAHEQGHTMGMSHKKGLMRKESGGKNLKKSSVKEVLKRSGLNGSEPNNNVNAQFQGATTIGEAPSNFNNGKVKKNKEHESTDF